MVELEVPDIYQMDEPVWTIEEAMNSYTDIEITNVTIVKS